LKSQLERKNTWPTRTGENAAKATTISGRDVNIIGCLAAFPLVLVDWMHLL